MYELPKVEGKKNKPEYCNAIMKARKILMSKILNTKEDTTDEITRQIKERRDDSRSGVQTRIKKIK